MITEQAYEMTVEEPSTHLRFVNKSGKMILQQLVLIKKFTTAHSNQIGQENVWRDIPVVEENKL